MSCVTRKLPNVKHLISVASKSGGLIGRSCLIFEHPCFLMYAALYTFESAQNKTYNKTCVTSKDKDQPVHSLSTARVLAYPSLDSSEAVEGTCDQQTLIRLYRCAG